jgi:hypothetical protein
MPVVSRFRTCGSLMIAGLIWSTAVGAAPLPAHTLASSLEKALIEVGGRWYRDLDDDDYYYPPEAYLPPPPPVEVVPPPPVAGYQPPVYGWIAPLRPASCGKYRYWNGERCADARDDPPYIGPRW